MKLIKISKDKYINPKSIVSVEAIKDLFQIEFSLIDGQKAIMSIDLSRKKNMSGVVYQFTRRQKVANRLEEIIQEIEISDYPPTQDELDGGGT